MRSAVFSLLAVAGSFAFAAPARACPVCDSENGAQVRAGLADGNLPLAIVAVVAPFVVVAGVVAAVHRGTPGKPRRRR